MGDARLGQRRHGVRRSAVAPRPAQIGQQIPTGLVPHPLVLLECLVERMRQLVGDLRIEPHRRQRRLVQDLVPDDPLGGAGERQLAGRHLVEHHAEGEKIGASVQRLATNLLRRHVGDRTHRGAGARQGVIRHGGRHLGLGVRPRFRGQLGEAEVEDLHIAALGDEDVGRLDVAMDDPGLVGSVERIGHLDAQLEDLLQHQRLTRDPILERLPLEILHDQKGLAVLLTDVVDGADMRVVQNRGGPRLALEALQGLPILDQALGKELERHRAAEAGVFRLVHHAHAASAETVRDAIVGDGFADQERAAGHQPPATGRARLVYCCTASTAGLRAVDSIPRRRAAPVTPHRRPASRPPP